jgi:lysosomal acid lipase/cholesteryl ester hydrolase
MGQLYESGKFQKFDYGFTTNLEKYGTPSPPEIDLSKITIPVGLFIGEQDQIADLEDNENLRKILPNVIAFRVLPNQDHLSLSF